MKALRHRSLQSTSVYLEADAADTDRARAKAIAEVAAPTPTMTTPSIDEIRREIARLSALALSMQAAQGKPKPTSAVPTPVGLLP